MPLRLAVIAVVMLATAPASADSQRTNELLAAWRSYSAHYQAGNYRDSLEPARRVHELAAQLLPDGDPQLAAATFNYGENLLRVHEFSLATTVLYEAKDRFEAAYGKRHIELLPVLLALARADTSRPGSHPNRRHLNSARKLVAATVEKDSVAYADHLLTIGHVALMGREEEDVNEALMIYRAELGADHMKTAQAAMALGRYFVIRGNRRTAAEYLRQALSVFDTSDPVGRQAAVVAHGLMVQVLERAGERDAATEHCLAVGRLTEGMDDADYLPIVRTAPRYPQSALADGVSGWVSLGFTVDEAGYAVNPEVLDYEGHSDFRQAAIAAVEQFRYAPRFENNEPVSVTGVQTTITFEPR